MSTKKNLHPILYIDDEKDNLTVFNAAFRRDFKVLLASSGAEGLGIMREEAVHLVITDQRMPEMTGVEFLEKIIPDYPDCIRIVLTGFSDVEAIIQAINKGRVYSYITKPWNREELKITINRALEAYNLRQQNKELIASLKEANENLERKVIERTKQIELQKEEITDSIKYASRIQSALLPPEEEIEKLLPYCFILNRPRDIVSGDYYWIAQKDNKVVVAVADCTGHGVPGAFMSILGIANLNEIVNKTEKIAAGDILNQLREQLIRSLRQTGKMEDKTRDSIEMALCIIDPVKNTLQYSGAFRPLYTVRNNELIEIKGDFMPIGIYEGEKKSFCTKEMEVQENDIIYMFSDGYVDQIGGPEKKTFRSKQFRQLLLGIHDKPLNDQKNILEAKLHEWKRDFEQIDDILVMGIKFPARHSINLS
jgi:serine phosphatase RsbU (regulator of sigma subunit)